MDLLCTVTMPHELSLSLLMDSLGTRDIIPAAPCSLFPLIAVGREEQDRSFTLNTPGRKGLLPGN